MAHTFFGKRKTDVAPSQREAVPATGGAVLSKPVSRSRSRNSGKAGPPGGGVNVSYWFSETFMPRRRNECPKMNRRPRVRVRILQLVFAAGSGSTQMSTHCPLCQSKNVSKSRRRGLLEFLVFRLIRVRPYRCQSCDLRFLSWAVPHEHRASRIATTGTRSDSHGAMSPVSERERS